MCRKMANPFQRDATDAVIELLRNMGVPINSIEPRAAMAPREGGEVLFELVEPLGVNDSIPEVMLLVDVHAVPPLRVGVAEPVLRPGDIVEVARDH